LLDGGLADNIGLRPILRSLGSTDRPTPSEGVQGGWSLLQLLNLGETDTVLVISVNARTDHAQDWDTHPAGPGTFSVINLSSGIPMGNYSSETLELLRQVAIANRLNEKDQPKLYGIEVSFDGLDATEQPFFRNLGTNFQLRPFEVDCLIDRGQRLLRTSTISTTETSTAFARFVENDLHGSIEIPTADSSTGSAPAACTPDAGTQRVGVRDHFLDVGIAATSVWPRTSLFNRNTSPGLAFRVVRPTGWNIALGIGPSSLSMSQRIDNQPLTIGDLRLFGFTGGLLRALRVGRLEATAGASGGYALGSFQLTTQARDAYARQGAFEITSRASNAWIAQPQSGLWFDLTNRFAITASAAYTVAHSSVRVSSDRAIINQRVDASALRVGFGVGYKIF
jgi:hypothetical protein